MSTFLFHCLRPWSDVHHLLLCTGVIASLSQLPPAAAETVRKLTYDSLIYFPALPMQEIHRLQWKSGMANPNSPPWTQGLSSPGSNLSFLLRSYCFPTQSECSEGTLLYRPWICSWFPNSQTFLMLSSPPGMLSTYPPFPDKINTPKPNSTPLPLWSLTS